MIDTHADRVSTHQITFDGDPLVVASTNAMISARLILGLAYGAGMITEPHFHVLADLDDNTFAEETLVNLTKTTEFTSHWIGPCTAA